MSKTAIIIEREFMTRIKSKQFIIFTILGPILMSLLFVIPILIAKYSESNETIWVDDRSGLFTDAFESEKGLQFVMLSGDTEALKDSVRQSDNTGLLIIPEQLSLHQAEGFAYYSNSPMGNSAKKTVERAINGRIEALKLEESGLSKSFIDSLEADIDLNTFKLTETGGEEDSSTGASTAIGFIGAFIMYLFIFIYGMMVLRGVVEEKSSRVMEVMVSSVKPFQLMLGKILGIAAVGLFQFILWILLTLGIVSGVTAIMGGQQSEELVKARVEATTPDMPAEVEEEAAGFDIMKELQTVNLTFLLSMFLFYFIGGYLIYASLFAAIGSAVDNEADTQQILFPVTIPIILAIIVAQMVIENPGSSVAFWFSMIPLTSPIVMLVRLPFGVPAWEIALSMVLVVAGFFGTVWIASRIYRVGVLMYGKKVTLKELGKWLFYKA